MHQIRSISFPIVGMLLLLTSCKKEDNNAYPLNTENFAGSYMLTAFTLQGEDVYNNPLQFQVCEKDDIYTFALNNTYSRTEGINACDPSSARTGSCSIVDGILMLDSVEYTVTSFTPTILEIEFREEDPFVPGEYEIWKYTFTKQ